MTDTAFWIWLQQVLGYGAALNDIFEYLTSPRELLTKDEYKLKAIPMLTSRQRQRVLTTSPNIAEEIIYNCKLNNWQIITYDSPSYPKRLKNIYNPPAVLYVDGKLPDLDSIATIGIVGTRRASEYAVMAAHIMSRGITSAGGLVISGGALGIDSAAHKGAIESGGITLAVLGSGIGSSYLKSNKNLRDVIKVNGALITEYPPFTSASKFTFPMRNRIISGLSVGVLVIEAGVHSGSLITSKYALEQGRDVFAVPGSVLSNDFAGTNKLIEDGAYVATTPESVISHYTEQFSNIDLTKIEPVSKMMSDETMPQPNITPDEMINESEKYSFDNLENGRKNRQQRQIKSEQLTGDIRRIYDILDEKYLTSDEITRLSGLTVSQVLSSLTQLEIMGLAVSASGKRFKLA